MKEENSKKTTPGRQAVLATLKNTQEIYFLFSGATRMPFVYCDGDTFDDEVLVFFRQADARKEAERLTKEKYQIQIAKLGSRQYAPFFTSLYPLGVNQVVLDRGTEKETSLPLEDLVTRTPAEDLPKDRPRIENPELHLTALYFMQELRRQPGQEMTAEMKEMQEEMMAHFSRGRFILAVQEGKGMPVLKQKDGTTFQPVFTDVAEFQKFSGKNGMKTAVVEASKIPEALAPEAAGVVINPFGVNVQLKIQRKKKETWEKQEEQKEQQ